MGGAIAGAVIGAVLLCGVALAVLFLWRRRKAQARRERAEVEIDDDRIDVTPFEGWHGSNPSMHQIHTLASGSNSVFPPSEQDSSHGASLVSLSKVQLVSPSNMRKSALQSTNMSSEGQWSERRRSTVSRTSIAPSYHTNAP
ncbi:hypothetical protein BDN70DRAFT_878650 [Pholiota conissans]|uniref:Uncharacterized protein n=1 Tax=Pholiota conissans TaxID=109636 RepID=A0A9P5Z1U0_9AGAR|nr:hypothetical protein BDN70DRAFT_878650 [Pholiota conissans]